MTTLAPDLDNFRSLLIGASPCSLPVLSSFLFFDHTASVYHEVNLVEVTIEADDLTAGEISVTYGEILSTVNGTSPIPADATTAPNDVT